MRIDLFSPLWFGLLGFAVVLLILFRVLLLPKPREKRLRVLTGFHAFVLVYWVIYKYFLAVEPSFEFIIWNEFPLHLCNVTTIFALIAVWKDSRLLQGFCYSIGTLGAIMAMLMPGADFSNVPLFSGLGLGYWGYHMLVIVQGLSFAALRIYEPKYRDIPRILGFTLIVLCVVHCINLLLRATVYPDANYFYTFGIVGNFIMDALYHLLPVGLLCILPLFLPAGAYCVCSTWVVRFVKKHFRTEQEDDLAAQRK